jgi:hypothetical protein
MEAAAAAAGFTSLAFQLFQGCVQAIAFFTTAQNIGVDGDLFRIGIEVQRCRLVQWGQKAGLMEEMLDDEKVHWELATSILEQLKGFLTSADQLSQRYSLVVTEEDVVEAEKHIAGQAPRQGLSKVIAKLYPDVYTISGKIIQSSNGTMKRLRWASVGRDKAKRILEEISRLIGHLELLLDSSDQIKRALEDARLLRNLVSFSTTAIEAGQIKELIGETPDEDLKDAIREAAWAKQVRLVIGADKREDEIQPKPNKETRAFMPELKINKKTLQPWRGNALAKAGVEFAQYNGRQVLVQWKSAEEGEGSMYEENMKRLAVLLMSLSHNSFRALPCEGYYPAKGDGRHGIIFAMPDESKNWSFKSLRDIMAEKKYVSLRRRIDISRALAKAVLQLHTSGWMHKSLRPENIIFLAPEGSENDVFLSHDPYIMAYDYSRPATDSGAAITQLPTEDIYADFYRHPDARGLLRKTYQKSFDMHALGCILVELALWESLIDLQSRLSLTNWRETMENAVKTNQMIDVPSVLQLIEISNLVEAIQHQAGETFMSAILTCFTMERTDTKNNPAVDGEITVVEQLSSCQV